MAVTDTAVKDKMFMCNTIASEFEVKHESVKNSEKSYKKFISEVEDNASYFCVDYYFRLIGFFAIFKDDSVLYFNALDAYSSNNLAEYYKFSIDKLERDAFGFIPQLHIILRKIATNDKLRDKIVNGERVTYNFKDGSSLQIDNFTQSYGEPTVTVGVCERK